VIVQAAAPVAPQTPPATLPQAVVDGQVVTTPWAVYQAYRAQSNELRDQLSQVSSERTSIAQRLRGVGGDAAQGADVAGLEKRLTQLDERIIDLQTQLATADAKVAESAAVPGATRREPPPFRDGPPEEAYILGMVFTMVVLLPMSIAFARRIWRRGSSAVAAIPKDIAARFTRLEEAVDAVALEVERIGEGQRFVTNLFIEAGPPRALGMGGMDPIEVRERERVERG